MDFLYNPYVAGTLVAALAAIGIGYTLWHRRHQS